MSLPTFERVMYVGLSVTDAQRSATWYREVLGFETERENVAATARTSDWDEVLLRHPHSNVRIGLLRHLANDGGPFSEFRTGLDHVEFEVASLDELDRWRHRLDSAGVPHSGARPHIVTFRDPDNIQLELYCEPAS
jgi:catechol 2,3-dioxygenase-like lactoylglutathione lyase family enzyme